MITMSSRQRMMSALRCQTVDHTPCSFMMYKSLLSRSASYLDFVQRQLDAGLDAFVQIPERPPVLVSDTYNLHGLPVLFGPSVKISEWKERLPGEQHLVLVKEYQTPAGILRAEVRQDPEWPYGDHVPFLDDYIETRSRKFLVDTQADLAALRYLLVPPTPAEIETFQQETRPLIDFARSRDLLLVGGWGVGADLIGWVYGLERMMYASYDNPQLLQELLEMIAVWNQARMDVVLSAGVDLYIKRAWYENCDFWSPKTWKKYILPGLQADAERAHDYGSLFGYLITANTMPLIDMLAESGVDVLIGIDPAKWDLAQTKAKAAGKVCLWGGVNGHLTIEQGSPAEVAQEVRTAMEILTPGSGFILSPVDNVRQDTPRSRENIQALLDTWRSLIAYQKPTP